MAADPRIDQLRECMQVVELPAYSRDYLASDKRSIANSVQVFFKDGSSSERIEVEFPLGHRRRRDQAIPVLREKFIQNVATRFPAERVAQLNTQFFDSAAIDQLAVDKLIDEFVQ